MPFNEIQDLVLDFLFEDRVLKALSIYKRNDTKVSIVIKCFLKNIVMMSEISSVNIHIY